MHLKIHVFFIFSRKAISCNLWVCFFLESTNLEKYFFCNTQILVRRHLSKTRASHCFKKAGVKSEKFSTHQILKRIFYNVSVFPWSFSQCVTIWSRSFPERIKVLEKTCIRNLTFGPFLLSKNQEICSCWPVKIHISLADRLSKKCQYTKTTCFDANYWLRWWTFVAVELKQILDSGNNLKNVQIKNICRGMKRQGNSM